jgi:tetratricopeptide (TPR) repeat protein
MRLKSKRIRLIALTMGVAGCARSDFPNMGPSRPGQRNDLRNVEDEAPPKILPETHFAAGTLFERQGQLDRAVEQYRKAAVLNHNYVAAYHRLGIVLSATGQHEDALKALRRAAQLRPENAPIRNNLGFEYLLNEQMDAAERELRRAVELQPTFARAHINLGLVLAKSGRFDESLASFRQALPESDAYYNLGLMFRGQQRYTEAVGAFERTLSLDPAFSAAKAQLDELMPRLLPAGPNAAAPGADVPMLADSFAALRFDPQPSKPVEIDEFDEGPARFDILAIVDDMLARSAVAGDQPMMEAPASAAPEREQGDGEQPGAEVAAVETLPVLLEEVMRGLGEPSGGEQLAGEEDSENYHMEVEFVEAAEPVETRPTLVDDSDFAPLPSPVPHGDAMIAVLQEQPWDVIDTPETMAPPSTTAMDDSAEPSPMDEPDADEVITVLAADRDQDTMHDSWAMLEELETKIALLHWELNSRAFVDAAGYNFGSPHEVHDGLPTWAKDHEPAINVEQPAYDETPIVNTDVAPAAPAAAEDPTASALPFAPHTAELSEDDAEWATAFGDLQALLSVVINETRCWEQLDREAQEVLVLIGPEAPCADESSSPQGFMTPDADPMTSQPLPAFEERVEEEESRTASRDDGSE